MPWPAQAAILNYFIIQQSVRPFQIEEPNQPLVGGIVTDIVSEIFKNSGHTLHPVVAPWPRLVLFARHHPNWLIYGTESPEEIAAELSAEPIFAFQHVIVSRRDSGFDFQSVVDLFGKDLILVHTFDYLGLDPFLRTLHNGPIKDVRAKDPEAALKMLAKGRGIAYVDDKARYEYSRKLLGMKPEIFKDKDFSTVIPTRPMHLIFDPHMPADLKAFINKRVRELKTSGRIQKILARYK